MLKINVGEKFDETHCPNCNFALLHRIEPYLMWWCKNCGSRTVVAEKWIGDKHTYIYCEVPSCHVVPEQKIAAASGLNRDAKLGADNVKVTVSYKASAPGKVLEVLDSPLTDAGELRDRVHLADGAAGDFGGLDRTVRMREVDGPADDVPAA